LTLHKTVTVQNVPGLRVFDNMKSRDVLLKQAFGYLLRSFRMPTNRRRTPVHWDVKYNSEWKDVPSVVIEYTSHTKWSCIEWHKLSWRESRGSTELLPQSWLDWCHCLVLHGGSKHEMGILRCSTLLYVAKFISRFCAS